MFRRSFIRALFAAPLLALGGFKATVSGKPKLIQDVRPNHIGRIRPHRIEVFPGFTFPRLTSCS